jgi:hypothetical protein
MSTVLLLKSVSQNNLTLRAAGLTRPLLEDRVAIADLISGLGLYTDQCEWDHLEAGYAPVVTTDYVSLFGGEPQTQPRAVVVATLRALMPGFDANQHIITTAEVQMRDHDHAVARSNVRACHRLGTSTWVLGGLYTHELVRAEGGWVVQSVKFTLAYEEGDRAIIAQAAERAGRVPTV